MKKKLLTTILCVGLLSTNLTGFASETAQVKVNCTNVPLQTTLNVKYSAYRIPCICNCNVIKDTSTE